MFFAKAVPGFNQSYIPHDWCLAHAKAGYESPRIDGAQISLDATRHENGDAKSPDHAQHARSLDTADSIANQESANQMQTNVSENESQGCTTDF